MAGSQMLTKNRLTRTVLASLLLLRALPLAAHHSIAAEFDSARPVVLHGKVTEVAWMNPHVYLRIDVADEAGKVTNWLLESAAPNYLQRLGWYKQSLKAGDVVTIRAFTAKDRANSAKTDAVTFPDGHTVTTGRIEDSSQPAAPK